MTLQESEKRRRSRYHDDDDYEPRSYRDREKKQVRPRTKFIFRVNGRPKPPAEIHSRSFKLGDVVSTSDGPHKVVEIYWTGDDKRGWKAKVLLRPLETKAPKDIKDDRKKPQKPQKRQNPSRRTHRPKPRGSKPARNQNKGKR